MDRYAMAREFEMTVMIDRIRRITDVQELHTICDSLVRSNFRMRESFSQAIGAERFAQMLAAHKANRDNTD